MTDKKEKELIEGCPWRKFDVFGEPVCKAVLAVGGRGMFESPCIAPDCGPMYFARLWPIGQTRSKKTTGEGDAACFVCGSEAISWADLKYSRALQRELKGKNDYQDGLKPKLKKFMWDILDEIQDRISEGEFKALFGTEEEARKASEAVAPHGIRLTIREFISLFDKDSLEKYIRELSEGIQDKAAENKKTGEGRSSWVQRIINPFRPLWNPATVAFLLPDEKVIYVKGELELEKSILETLEKIQVKNSEALCEILSPQEWDDPDYNAAPIDKKNRGEGDMPITEPERTTDAATPSNEYIF